MSQITSEKSSQFDPKQHGLNLHKFSTDDGDIQAKIDSSPCAAVYYALEECLIEEERKWNRCQIQVSALLCVLHE